MPIATIEEAIEKIRLGRMVILMDDKNRENEGDLCGPRRESWELNKDPGTTPTAPTARRLQCAVSQT